MKDENLFKSLVVAAFFLQAIAILLGAFQWKEQEKRLDNAHVVSRACRVYRPTGSFHLVYDWSRIDTLSRAVPDSAWFTAEFLKISFEPDPDKPVLWREATQE